ncbi:proline-rich receptor-like protein kinase PERK10 isoform X2 [Daphnia magna]|uniref:proline-rich receptor-like protein kinase PERK10 isoform X2 n=1 Tax=Daphnia magna TaxID=35525 RepID=UPI001E1BBDBA|nr:proline-rich receptor-like protein kinase PERK10 isoform X2 [Daphnia magna]
MAVLNGCYASPFRYKKRRKSVEIQQTCLPHLHCSNQAVPSPRKNMKFSASAAIFLALCLVYVHADERHTPSYGGNRPPSYRPPSHHLKPHPPKPLHPLPYHPKPQHPLPYHPKPQHPLPYHPKPQHPLPYRPKPQRPTHYKPKPQHPKPHRPSVHRPKPQRPNRPWVMKPQSDNTNININRNKNSNEGIILAELFSQLIANEEDPCLFGLGCFEKKLKTKDIVVEAKANSTQEEEAATTSDAADATTNDTEDATISDAEEATTDDSEASLDQTEQTEEEDAAVVVESRQEGQVEEDDGMAMF